MDRSLLVIVVCFGVTLAELNETIENSVTGATEKTGRCPKNVMEKSMCPDDIEDQCDDDFSCYGNSKCCSTGCAKVCVSPVVSVCDLARENTIRRGRALGVATDKMGLPDCEKSGEFVPIQCRNGTCFCVDQDSGFEKPGTRARSLNEVNCMKPKPCAGYVCRMLCPFGFTLDEEGCPLCECRDPCHGVKCPGTGTCIMEEVPCSAPPCPPLPTCKQPRSLQNMCPFGEPLMVGDHIDQPYLCGNDESKPSCPPLYQCLVNHGHDYGVCCTATEEVTKPGVCPIEGHSITIDEESSDPDQVIRCGASCQHDFQCPSTQKCCLSEVCGQHCVHPTNLTVCQHQRMVAELLIATEKEGKGYIPQCDETTGLFTAKQCSRNGLVCWCVGPNGEKYPRTMAASHEVDCIGISGHPLTCKNQSSCTNSCEYGYAVDENGCSACKCEDPCNELRCDDSATCVMRPDPTCGNTNCPGVPMCVSNDSSLRLEETSVHISVSRETTPAKCNYGVSPLSVGGVVAICSFDRPCPDGFVCSILEDNTSACCPQEGLIGSKRGQCPFIGQHDPALCVNENRCYSDSACSSDKKCCVVASCGGPVCLIPLPVKNESQELWQGPTMCEYLRDLVHLEGVSLALPTPHCDINGAFEPVQCNELGQCWCVDDYGVPIPNTKVSNRQLVVCDRLEMELKCDELVCRIGCNYGYILDQDTACPMCQCREPCDGVDCGLLHECQMVDVPCIDGICPSIPQCVARHNNVNATCAQGIPYTVNNITIPCSSRARALECPSGYTCQSDLQANQGVCCPLQDKSGKAGQCPYLVGSVSDSCDLECSEDSHCKGDHKCCSNGCGTYCSDPMKLTACQHQRNLLEHHAKQADLKSDQVFLPECDNDGNFKRTQCHPGTLTCWCVDDQGQEQPGTRVSSPAQPNCQKPLICPAMNCDLACLHGYQLDGTGCPICSCIDPCEEVACSSPNEECRIVHVACIKDPCPPLPVCLPRLDNPCQTGSPLSINGSFLECGPKGMSCPSSHKCHLSPLGEFAVCCPKPRDVCFNNRDFGNCEGSIQRWFFNSEINRCEQFRYSACGGNLNNFQSKSECEKACPVLTTCQMARHKSLQNSQKDKKIRFLPKCHSETGDWEPSQCLPELGICWCVNRNGSQVPGTLTRGSPDCFTRGRSARLLNYNPSETNNMICEPGESVHLCNKELCENKVCLSHPDAICRVNPCGGCSLEFVDIFNNAVDCNEGLTGCQKQLQKILNSAAFARPSLILTDVAPANSHLTEYVQLQNSDVYHTDLPEATQSLPEDNISPPPQIISPSELTKHENDVTRRGNIKQGSCPEPMAHISLLQCNPTEDCSSDSDCPNSSKCCFTGCGTMCLQPLGLPEAVGMVVEPSQCHSDGSWVNEQRSGDLTWCVDSQGNPIPETLTRGHVRCGPNGRILEQIAIGNVCPASVKPMVCRDECLNAVCPGHPSAVCVADPCNQCKVFFVSVSGDPIRCEPKCSQPLAVGGCRASFKRFFYNSTSNQCEQFVYGGCQGNDNNFATLQQCEDDCSKTVLNCDLPLRVGQCDKEEARWFFNKDTQKCQPFLYSGCDGNGNNFQSKDECEQSCPDLVLCPYWSSSSMEPIPCSRSEACKGEPCFGHAGTVCKVDPCTCTAQIVNLDGEDVFCMMMEKDFKTRLAYTYEEAPIAEAENLLSQLEVKASSSPIRIFLEGESSLTRCQLLQKHLEQTNSKHYVAQCDEEGRFRPQQCYSASYDNPVLNNIQVSSKTEDNYVCWCVDEIGRKVEPTVYFQKDERQCRTVLVESVLVTLGFKEHIEKVNSNENLVKKQVRMLLDQLSAATVEDDVNIIKLPDSTQIKFTLLGKNKLDIAYQLEDQVRRGSLSLQLGRDRVLADVRSSWFHHQVFESQWPKSPVTEEGTLTVTQPREVVSQMVYSSDPFVAATVIASIITVIIICSLVMAAVLYRKHITGKYPKTSHGSMQSLALSDSSLDRKSWPSQRFASPYSATRLNRVPRDDGPSISTIEQEFRDCLY